MAKIFGRHKLVPTLRSGKVWQIWCFAMFLSILLPLSRNLIPSLRTTSYVHESRRWQTFSLFALTELVCTKKIFYPILLFSTFSPQASSPLERYRQKDGQHSSPPVTKVLFFSTERAGPYPQAQLYWAGQTMGWMADWTRDDFIPAPTGTVSWNVRVIVFLLNVNVLSFSTTSYSCSQQMYFFVLLFGSPMTRSIISSFNNTLFSLLATVCSAGLSPSSTGYRGKHLNFRWGWLTLFFPHFAHHRLTFFFADVDRDGVITDTSTRLGRFFAEA